MASLPESSTFDAGVYQLELTDPVIGGPSGVSNTPLKNLANRTKYLKDHVDALESSRAPLASPAFTGTPTAPTAAQGTNTTQVATTAFVNAEIAADMAGNLATVAPPMNGAAAVGTSGKMAREDHVHPTDTSRAPLASPAFTGTPTAPTAAAGTNTTQVATTAFVKNAVDSNMAAPATVDLAGLIELATNAEVAAGADAVRAVTPAALKALFTGNQSLATNGYLKLPGGMILQWGYYSRMTATYQRVTVTFPIAFPNGVLSVQMTAANMDSGTACAVPQCWFANTVQFGIMDGDIDNTPWDVYWFAIGY